MNTTNRKPRGYWLNEANVIKELKSVCSQLGHFPTQKELVAIGMAALHMGMHQHEKPIQYYQELLGYPTQMKPIGYWTENTLKQELKQVVSSLGYFPTQSQLRKIGRADITKAIDRLGVNYYRLQIEFGFVPRERPKKYWKNWDNLVSEIETIIVDDRFPTLEMIRSNLSKGAIRGVMLFGGISEVATKMGYDPPSFILTTDGHAVQSSYEYMFDEWLHSQNIEHTYGGLIDLKHKFRYDFKVGSKYVEIWGYEKTRMDSKRCIRYNEKRTKKEQLYHDLGLSLVSIDNDVFDKPADEMKSEFAIKLQ